MTQTVRLQDFARIAMKERDALRTEEQRGTVPWTDEDFPTDAKQRRYSGFHVLALVVRDLFSNQGLTAADAAETVRIHAERLRDLLARPGAGEVGERVFVPVFWQGVLNNYTGFQWERADLIGMGTAKEVVQTFADLLNAVGTERPFGNTAVSDRIVAGPRAAIVELREAYRIAQARADQAGFAMRGFDIFLRSQETEEASE